MACTYLLHVWRQVPESVAEKRALPTITTETGRKQIDPDSLTGSKVATGTQWRHFHAALFVLYQIIIHRMV